MWARSSSEVGRLYTAVAASPTLAQVVTPNSTQILHNRLLVNRRLITEWSTARTNGGSRARTRALLSVNVSPV